MSAKKDDVQSFLDSFASGLASAFAGAPSNQPERRFVRKDIELRKMGSPVQPDEKMAPSANGPKSGK